MTTLDQVLRERLISLDRAGLQRQVQTAHAVAGVRVSCGGRSLLSFASNDYLGLAQHPAVGAAAIAAVSEFGAGARASRLLTGSLQPHEELEHALARFKRTEGTVTFSSGYATALGTIPALVGPGDYVLLDRLAHACLVDGARLSGARLRVFKHNDVADLERLLRWVAAHRKVSPNSAHGTALVVTESVFSMDGDRAPLREIVEVKARHGAWLLVDEAHATGILGPDRQGCVSEPAVAEHVEICMGTLGKALGAAGGFIAGSSVLCDYLVNRARSLMFSTAPPPAVAAAARAALAIVVSSEGATLVGLLRERCVQAHSGLADLGWPLPSPPSPILPLIVGAENNAVRLAAALRENGLLVPPIRHPTVPRGRARLRVTLSAAHTHEDVALLVSALQDALDRTGLRPNDAMKGS